MRAVIYGVLTRYEIVGGGKRRLVILHGWRSSLDQWRPVVENFGKDFRILLLDFPGHGQSGDVPENWDLSSYVNFVVALLKKVGWEKVTVLGHSFGGRVALKLASQSGGMLEKLILVDAAGMEVKSIGIRIKIWFFKLLKPFFRVIPESVRRLILPLFGSSDYLAAGSSRVVFKRIVGQNLKVVLSKISAKTVILWGENDKELMFFEAETLREGIEGSVLRVVWGAGHSPHTEKPADFLRILEEEGI